MAGIHDGHRDRLRKKYVKNGLENLEPHEILELLLFYAIPRRDTNPIAHALIKRFGSLSEVFNAPVHKLEEVDDVTHNAAVLISMIPQLSRVYLTEQKRNREIAGKDMLNEYIVNQFIGLNEEHVLFVCVDNRMQLISADVVSKGSVNAAGVNMRTMVDLALRHNAVAVILAHNHPRGVALPSREDLVTTQLVHDALATINVHLIDHIICSPDDHISLADTERFDYLFE